MFTQVRACNVLQSLCRQCCTLHIRHTCKQMSSNMASGRKRSSICDLGPQATGSSAVCCIQSVLRNQFTMHYQCKDS